MRYALAFCLLPAIAGCMGETTPSKKDAAPTVDHGGHSAPDSVATRDGSVLPDTGSTSTACGKIGRQGCCVDERTLKWCDADNRLVTFDCLPIPKCGWDPARASYACDTAGGADPSKKYPLRCP
ncbi:MAG: hypothetical protein IT371_00420 [Deltaproteobacteria bacterium]|nr:hypothetical protein [Deltaproteobacteria bacterium]